MNTTQKSKCIVYKKQKIKINKQTLDKTSDQHKIKPKTYRTATKNWNLAKKITWIGSKKQDPNDGENSRRQTLETEEERRRSSPQNTPF